jgi:hypothetical protein
MLKKLLKYEFRYYRKFMLITLLVTLASVLFLRLAIFAFTQVPEFAETTGDVLISLSVIPLMILSTIFYYSAIFSLLVPHVFGAIRFYRNLTMDQGYLSFTLPVKPSQHIFCKTLVPTVWTLILTLALIASGTLAIVIGNNSLQDIAEAFQILLQEARAEGIMLGVWLVLAIVLMIMAIVASVSTVNLSISLGQLFRKHKLIGSILSYWGLNTVVSTITGIVSVFPLFLIDYSAPNAGPSLNGFMIGMLLLMTVVMMVVTAVTYWGSCHIMTKKLNLE